jgi:hypothetical protein
VSVGVITTMLAYGGTSSSGTAASGTLLDQFGSFAGVRTSPRRVSP